jgi:hypothetical protein
MHQCSLAEQVRLLKAQLEQIDKKLQSEPLPIVALEDLKGAVDQLRSTLWALMTHDSPDAVTSKLITFRLVRAAEICRQVQLDIDASEVGISSPQLPKLREALRLTMERVERLYRSGM